MDSRVSLIGEFYRGLPKERAKVETYESGFEYLERLLTDGMELEYAEMPHMGLLHKYKLSNIPRYRMVELLLSHVEKRANLCLYFHDEANSLFCFNLDNNSKTNNTALIPEMQLAAGLLREQLTAIGCEPLLVASGRGYHVWCRLASPVANKQLYDLMLYCMARVMAGLHERGLDYNKVKANFYPDPRTQNVVSLRLFGTEHARNKVFSRILSGDAILDEAASWAAFEEHVRTKTIADEAFQKALSTMAAAFRQGA